MFALAGAAQQDRDTLTAGFKDAHEGLSKKIDSLGKQNSKNLADSLSRVNSAIKDLKEKSNAFDWKLFLPWFFSIIAIVFTILGYKREGSYKHLTFLTDKNKMMVTEPKLWAIYDVHRNTYTSNLTITGPCTLNINGEEELLFLNDGTISMSPVSGLLKFAEGNAVTQISNPGDFTVAKNNKYKLSGKATVQIPTGVGIEIKSQLDKEMEGKIRAFCYYTLNSFELVFRYNRGRNSRTKAWENYIIDILVRSSMFREIVESEVKGKIFDEGYQEKLKGFLVISCIIKKLKDGGNKYKNDDVFNYTERLSYGITNNYLTQNSSVQEIEEFLDLQT